MGGKLSPLSYSKNRTPDHHRRPLYHENLIHLYARYPGLKNKINHSSHHWEENVITIQVKCEQLPKPLIKCYHIYNHFLGECFGGDKPTRTAVWGCVKTHHTATPPLQ